MSYFLSFKIHWLFLVCSNMGRSICRSQLAGEWATKLRQCILGILHLCFSDFSNPWLESNRGRKEGTLQWHHPKLPHMRTSKWNRTDSPNLLQWWPNQTRKWFRQSNSGVSNISTVLPCKHACFLQRGLAQHFWCPNPVRTFFFWNLKATYLRSFQ